ncbi:MAG: hypothetical protein Q9203_000950 [Teloschistes exilis]
MVDLSKPWDWKTNVSIKALAKPGMPVLPTSPPVVSRGAFYYGSDNDPNIYLWGGTTSKANPSFPGFIGPLPITFTMWSFNTHSHVWDHYDLSDSVPYRASSGAYAEVRDQHRSFYLNGQVDSGSSTQTMSLSLDTKIFQEGMIVIDHSNQTAKNISTKGLVGDKPRTRGRMQYISGLGSHGILVLIGGNEKNVTDTKDQSLGDLVPMDKVHIFDVSSIYDDRINAGGSWYEQSVTGDIPEKRVDFCLILARAIDTSSANIYMYGGRGENDAFFDDIHVLSMPSFTWTKVYQGNSGRYGQTCHRAGARTMISVGGASGTNLSTSGCDWQNKGLNVLDLSSLNWSTKYTMTTEDYAMPTAVTARIGGNAQGNATMVAPDGGFDQVGLAQLFGSDSIKISNTSQPAATGGPVADRVRRAIIAGSVVGGTVFLGLALAIIWFLRHSLYHIWIGDLSQRIEMEGRGKCMSELPDKGVSWELPGNAPVELWSPTSPVSPLDTADFKHETKSDRDLGWRGETECEGDASKTEYVIDERDKESMKLRHTQVTCKELD